MKSWSPILRTENAAYFFRSSTPRSLPHIVLVTPVQKTSASLHVSQLINHVYRLEIFPNLKKRESI